MKIETNPMCVYLVKNDSKGDKLLFRYPFGNSNCTVKTNANEPCKRSLHRNASLDGVYYSQEQTDFPDDVISSLFAVKMDLCDRKFELKVNNIRFIGHPIQIQTGGSNRKKKPESPSIILINVVFALDAFARRQIAHCYYDLSKMIGIALGHEEKRCSYLSKQIKSMLAIHDSMASG